ncbi:MAG: hypothetical protein WAM28_01720 [Chlamydiales bacterium]
MDTPLAVDNKPSNTTKVFLSFCLPKGLLENIFLWSFLPVVLLLLTVWASFLASSPFTYFIPLFALAGPLACYFWKTIGLSASYLLLLIWTFFALRDVSSDQYFSQIGITVCLFIDYFIVFLSIKEVKANLKNIVEESQLRLEAIHQTRKEMQQIEQATKEEREEFELQIEKLKEEAEQRRIEKQQDNKRFELIQSEIEMLTEQKEELIADAFEARKIANEDDALQALLESQEKILSLQAALSQNGEAKSIQLSAEAIDEFEKEIGQLEEEITCLEGLISHVLSR